MKKSNMNEDSRRRIARKFLEENFGKYGLSQYNITIGGKTFISMSRPFELYRTWDSMRDGDFDNDARAFEVIYAPYVSEAEHKMIAVSDSQDELNEIVNKCFDKERVKLGLIEFEDYKGYKIAYD